MSTIHHIDKVIRFGTKKTAGGRIYNVYAHIYYHNEALSITGVEGPLESGNCLGSCGQIVDSLVDFENFADGWNEARIQDFAGVWDQWHLNDLKAECQHQRALGQTWKTHPSSECETCGYVLGSAWLTEAIPDAILKYLDKLPYSTKKPAWV